MTIVRYSPIYRQLSFCERVHVTVPTLDWLAMDLMSRVTHLPSFRSQFVNLWIDDGDGPEDYGLFTHIERSNDDYLESLGLDKDGNLYKAEEFRFALADLENMRVDDEGEPLDEERFETSLEIQEGKDHRALANMMSALHDSERSFESVLDEYFNRNNVLAWLATKLLLRYADGTRHNDIMLIAMFTSVFFSSAFHTRTLSFRSTGLVWRI